jgi:DNA-binding MarR family transcriptional regulator
MSPDPRIPAANVPLPPAVQVELDDAVARLSVVLGRLTRMLRQGSGTGLGPGGVSALATLVRSGPMRLGDLAVREGVAPPTLTRIVAGLEDGGLVTRRPDPDDGRATQVQATDAAHEIVTGLGSTRFAKLHARISALPAADRDVLLRAVPVMEAIAADDEWSAADQ